MAKRQRKKKLEKDIPEWVKRVRAFNNRKVPTIGSVIPQILAQYGLTRRLSSEHLRAAWLSGLEKYGPPIDYQDRTPTDFWSEQTALLSLRRGTLQVSVSGSVLMQELSFCSTDLLNYLQTEVPEETIRRIRFKIQG